MAATLRSKKLVRHGGGNSRDDVIHEQAIGPCGPFERRQQDIAKLLNGYVLTVDAGIWNGIGEPCAALAHFIFVTAYDQYTVEAFRLQALDYLLKPVDKLRLAATIDRARRMIQDKKVPEAPAAKAPVSTPRRPICRASDPRWCSSSDRTPPAMAGRG